MSQIVNKMPTEVRIWKDSIKKRVIVKIKLQSEKES